MKIAILFQEHEQRSDSIAAHIDYHSFCAIIAPDVQKKLRLAGLNPGSFSNKQKFERSEQADLNEEQHKTFFPLSF